MFKVAVLPSCRNPRKTGWNLYKHTLHGNVNYIKTKVCKIQTAVISSCDNSYPMKTPDPGKCFGGKLLSNNTRSDEW